MKDFQVEKIIDKRTRKDQSEEYKVLWKNYPPSQASWVKVEDMNCPALVQEFEENKPKRKAKIKM